MAHLKKIFYEYHGLDLDFDHVTCIFGHQRPQYHNMVKQSQLGEDEGSNLTPLYNDCHIHKHHNMNILTTEEIIVQHNLIWTPFN